MKYGKYLTLAERWRIESDIQDGKELPPLPKRKQSGEEIQNSTLSLAEDFFGLSEKDVISLNEDEFSGLKYLDGQFDNLLDCLTSILGYKVGFKKLESLCNEGLGETFNEMYANSPKGTLIPKYVRDYMLEQGADEEDIQILLADGDSIAKSLFMEASYAKLGLE